MKMVHNKQNKKCEFDTAPNIVIPHTLVLIFFILIFQKLHNKKRKFHKNLNQQEFGKKFESEKLGEGIRKNYKLETPVGN